MRTAINAVAVSLLTLISATTGYANWLVDGARVASSTDGRVSAVGHGGSEVAKFTVDANTTVQLELAGAPSDVQIGQAVRLIVPQKRIEPGATAITVKRIRILEVTLRRDAQDRAAGYHSNYVEGVVTSLSPYLQIETPSGLTVTAAVTPNLQVITYRFGTAADIRPGAIIDADLRKDKNTGVPSAVKVWVWDVVPN